MMLLVSGATATLRKYQGQPHLGYLFTPNSGNSVRSIMSMGFPWAIDNGAYSGFNAHRFEKLLDLCEGLDGKMWVAAPDVVADHWATLKLFDQWADKIAARKFPLAFVAQNGATICTVPWDHIRCLFIGGDTAWKLSDEALWLIRAARSKCKLVHIGRVNSYRRLIHFAKERVSSIDGTACSMFPDTYIPKLLKWCDYGRRQQAFS